MIYIHIHVEFKTVLRIIRVTSYFNRVNLIRFELFALNYVDCLRDDESWGGV